MWRTGCARFVVIRPQVNANVRHLKGNHPMLRPVSIAYLSSVVCAAFLQSQAIPPTPAAVLAILQGIVQDSLSVGGRSEGQTYAPANDSTALWLAAAHVPLTRRGLRPLPRCPGSTTAENQDVASSVGYLVEVKLRAEDAGVVWVVEVTKRCHFEFRGRDSHRRGFAESATWELMRVQNAWRIVRSRGHHVT